MDAIESLLQVYDCALSDEWESLASACRDLTEDEAAWQPPAYAAEPHDDGVGRPGTILWHLNHLELCHRHYTAKLGTPDPAFSPDTEPPGELPLERAEAALKAASVELRMAITNLSPKDLTRQVRPARTVASFIAMICCHITWHAGMIKQTRRLYRQR